MLSNDERRRFQRLHRYIEANNKVIRTIMLSDTSATSYGKAAVANLQAANTRYIKSIIELTRKARKVKKTNND